MEWTEDHDHSLCQEILALEPFKAKKAVLLEGKFGIRLPVILTPWKFQDLKLPSAQ